MTRTLYRTDDGPVVDLSSLNPFLGWRAGTAFVVRDVNATNHRTFRNWMRWARATSLDDFTAIQREESAIPWVNTVAVGRGSARAWYAEIRAIPNVSEEQVATCTTAIGQAMATALPQVRSSTARAGPANGRTTPTRSSLAPWAPRACRACCAATTLPT